MMGRVHARANALESPMSKHGRRGPVVLAVCLVAVASACGNDNKTTSAPIARSGATTTSVVAARDTQWPRGGHDLGSERWNAAERQLDPTRVKTLKVLWHIDDLKGVTGTPAVVDGTVYVGGWNGDVRAIDAASGDRKWSTKIGDYIAGSPTVTTDAVYVAAKQSVYRLDRSSGTVTWRSEVNRDAQTQLYAGPLVVDGLVVQSISGYPLAPGKKDYTFRGNVVALDEHTGKLVWRVYLSDNNERSGAGVSVWAAPSADPVRSLVFVGTGNSYEEPTSPYADSLVAIDYKRGSIVWSKQFTFPDVYNIPEANGANGPDADIGSTPTLWSVDGRDFVGAADKAGTFHALDRDSGKIVWETKLTRGSGSGGVIGGSAFADGRIFVASNIGDVSGRGTTGVTTLFALDASNGKVVWRTNMAATVFAPTSVAGGVVYLGNDAPAMRLFDAATGKSLFQYKPPAAVGGGAAVSDGHVYWGYGLSFTEPGPDAKGGIIAFG